MKEKLLYVAFAFVCAWTLGEVCQEPYSRNLIQSVTLTATCAIWLGVHSMIWASLKERFA